MVNTILHCCLRQCQHQNRCSCTQLKNVDLLQQMLAEVIRKRASHTESNLLDASHHAIAI